MAEKITKKDLEKATWEYTDSILDNKINSIGNVSQLDLLFKKFSTTIKGYQIIIYRYNDISGVFPKINMVVSWGNATCGEGYFEDLFEMTDVTLFKRNKIRNKIRKDVVLKIAEENTGKNLSTFVDLIDYWFQHIGQSQLAKMQIKTGRPIKKRHNLDTVAEMMRIDAKERIFAKLDNKEEICIIDPWINLYGKKHGYFLPVSYFETANWWYKWKSKTHRLWTAYIDIPNNKPTYTMPFAIHFMPNRYSNGVCVYNLTNCNMQKMEIGIIKHNYKSTLALSSFHMRGFGVYNLDDLGYKNEHEFSKDFALLCGIAD